MAAYNLRNASGNQDDDEFGASSKILQQLKEEHPLNIAVFVVRDFGGTKLGRKRFDIILQVAKQAIQRIGK